jgi:hypothetical protein
MIAEVTEALRQSQIARHQSNQRIADLEEEQAQRQVITYRPSSSSRAFSFIFP